MTLGNILDQPFSVMASTGFSGGAQAAAPINGAPAIASSAGAGPHDLSAHALLSLRNPITWFGLLAGVTFGLIAFSSSVRVGKTKAKASIGKE